GLHKGYDRFQTLLSQLEIHGADVSHEDANQKFLRSLPSSWSQVALIMKTKPRLDTLSFDDLYNNLRVFERDVKGTTASSSSNTHNVAFVFADNTSSTNDSGHVKKDTQNYAMMGYSSSNSGSDNESVFMNKESDLEDTHINDRYATRMHAVPPPMTGNYMPFGPDVEIDYSIFTYGPKQTLVDKSDSKPSEYASCESNSSVETTTSMPTLVENAPKVVCKPKVWTNAPIIEEYESDSNDDYGNVKETCTPNHCPKFEKQDRHSDTKKGLGYAFSKKSCFVCGSFSHLIRDCDFHEKRMGKQAALTKSKDKVTGQRENRPVWNNFQTVKHQNKFVPSVLLTKTGKFPVNASRQNFSRQATSTSIATKVNTARPFVNETRPKRYFYESHSPNKRPVRYKITQRTTFLYHKVNTVNTSLSAVKGNVDTAVKALAENQANKSAGLKEANNSAGTQANDDQSANTEEINLYDEHFILPIWSVYSTTVKSSRDKIQKTSDYKTCKKPVSQVEQIFQEELEKLKRQEKEANDAVRKEATHENQNANTNSTNLLNAVSTPISTDGPSIALNDGEPLYPNDPSMPHLEDIYASLSEGIFTDSSYDDEGVVTDFNNLEATVNVSPTPTTRIHTIHPKTQILGDPLSTVQTRSKVHNNSEAHALVWILVDLPFGKKAIGTKWLYKNKKDERAFVVRNKARLVAQGHSVKTASTPIKTQKPLVKDNKAADVDVHLYRSMIGSLMYLTASRPDIMFAVFACSRFQATVSIKKVKDVVKLQALIDRKKVVVSEDIICQDLRLDDADGVECFPTEEIFAELARMGYEKPPPKLTFYKAMVRNVDSPSKFLMYPQFLQVLINNQVENHSSHKTNYTSPALTQKVFANMRRTGKGFSEVETPLFATMLVQPQAIAKKEDEEDEVPAAPTPPSPTHEPTPPLQEPITSPLQAQSGRLEEKDEVNVAAKEVNATEPNVFDDKEVTMTMAQTLIKMKAKKARLLDEQMAKRLHDEKIKQARKTVNQTRKKLIEDMLLLEGTPKEGKSQENIPLELNSVLFNDTKCIVSSPNFKLIDESQVLLRVPRKNNIDSGKKVDEDLSKGSECRDQEQDDNVNNTNNVNVASTNEVNAVSKNISNELPFNPNMPALEDISIFNFSSDHEDDDDKADINNMDTKIQVSRVPTTRIHKDHPFDQVIRDLHSTTQTRNMSKNLEEHGLKKRYMFANHQDLKIKTFLIKCTKMKKHYMDYIKLLEHEVKNASTPMETQKPLLKDKDGEEVDVHMYRSMIGSLMYLTSSRPDIMFAVCACARYQVNPNVSHLHAVKRIFRKHRKGVTEVPQPSDPMKHVVDEAVYKELDDKLILGKDASKQERKIYDIDADVDITLVNDQDDEHMFYVEKDLQGEEVFVAKQDENVIEKEVDAAQVQVSTVATTATILINEVTLAQALAKLKHIKHKDKAKGIVFHEPEESTTTTATIPKAKSHDNELQGKFVKEQRLVSKKAQQEEEANIDLIETWNDVQEKIDADYQLPKRPQNVEGKKLNSLKNKSFANIQELFDKAMKRVNTFVDYRTELVEESSKKAKAKVIKGSSKRADTELEQESLKRARTELEQESFEKQKIDDDNEMAKLKQLVKIIPNEEGVAIDAIPLVVKPPSIVD
nr:ribonuclease H-like domain, Gag-pre-integrase domain protein [Tanacetum cinerariifolium]